MNLQPWAKPLLVWTVIASFGFSSLSSPAAAASAFLKGGNSGGTEASFAGKPKEGGKKKAPKKPAAKKSSGKKGGNAKKDSHKGGKKDGHKGGKKDGHKGGKKDGHKAGNPKKDSHKSDKKDDHKRGHDKKDDHKRGHDKKDDHKRGHDKKDDHKRGHDKKDDHKGDKKDDHKKRGHDKKDEHKGAKKDDHKRGHDKKDERRNHHWARHADRRRRERHALRNLSTTLSTSLSQTTHAYSRSYSSYSRSTWRSGGAGVNVAAVSAAAGTGAGGWCPGLANPEGLSALETGAADIGFSEAPALESAVNATRAAHELAVNQRSALVSYRNYLLGANLAAVQKDAQLRAVQDALLQDAIIEREGIFGVALAAAVPGVARVNANPKAKLVVAGINPVFPSYALPPAAGEKTATVVQATPSDPKIVPALADVDPDAAVLLDDSADVTQSSRYVRLANNTDREIIAHLRYQAKTKQGEKWYPDMSEPDVTVKIGPRQVVDLKDGKWRIHAQQLNLWAESGNRSWTGFKTTPLNLVPETAPDGKHLYKAPVRDVFTYAFK